MKMAGHDEVLQDILQPSNFYESHLLEPGKFDVCDFLNSSQQHSLVASQNDTKTAELLREIKTFYDTGLFCDLKLVAGNVDMGFNSVLCHSLVLASAIPDLLKICQSASEAHADEEFARIYLPEFSFDDLKTFIESIYMTLINNNNVMKISASLVQALGLKSVSGVINMTLKPAVNSESDEDLPLAKRSSRKRRQVQVPQSEPELNEGMVDYEDSQSDEKEEKPLKKRGRPPKNGALDVENELKTASGNLQEISQITVDQLINQQMENLNLPYNWALSDPSLFSNANEYRKLLETSQDAGTVVHASTGVHFNFTEELQSPWQETYSNKMPKLIRMPETTISVIVAIGIRNGLNVIQAVGMPNWPLKANFDNILEMFLNTSGSSKNLFFSHDRYYKFKKIASKPNRVGRAMQSIRKLSEEDQTILRHETQKDIQELEAERSRLNFIHLPMISVKMQFSHVSDMTVEEILDYAVLYGNETNNLKIKSFSHLQARDYSASTWASIFIDLMVSLLSLDNPLTLRTHSSTKDLFDPIDQLVFRHQAFELMTNPSRKYCIPCRIVFPYSTAQEIMEFDLHNQEHNIKKEDSAGLLTCTGSNKCSKMFQTQEALNEHVSKCHDKSVKGDGSYCDTCGKFLPNVHRLKKHHDAHHRQIKCKVCGGFFPGTIGLASHRDRVHSQQLPCPHCNKLLPSRVKLEYHMISHMAPEEKKYICEKCGKRFGWSHHLAKHEMNVHVRSRPYKCSVEGCNWAFNDLSNRNMHERRVHKLGPPPKR